MAGSADGKDSLVPTLRDYDNARHGGTPVGMAGALGRSEYLRDQDALRGHRGPTGRPAELGAFGKCFVGFGLLLLGYRIAPGAGAPGEAWIMPGGVLALGALGLLRGMRERAGWQPFGADAGARGWVLRRLWFFVPPLWMALWGLLLLGFATIGSPHLRIVYGSSGCSYLGLNGWVEQGYWPGCPLVRLVTLD
jgi:hypothetical protein